MTQCEGHWNVNRNVWNFLSPAAVLTVDMDSLLYIVALKGYLKVTVLLNMCNMQFFKQTFICNIDLSIATSCGHIRNFADCCVLNCNSQTVMCLNMKLVLFWHFSIEKHGHLKVTHQDCYRQLLVTWVVGLPLQCRSSLHSSGMLCCLRNPNSEASKFSHFLQLFFWDLNYMFKTFCYSFIFYI
jgi:hypothetical protein